MSAGSLREREIGRRWCGRRSAGPPPLQITSQSIAMNCRRAVPCAGDILVRQRSELRLLGGFDGVRAPEKVEVAALGRLVDVLQVEAAVSPAEGQWRRLPGGPATRQLGVIDMEMDAPRGHVQLDFISVAHQRQRTANGAFGGDVQDDRAERRAAPVSYTHLRAHETVLDLVC